jgi:hypothetical protein
MESFRKNVEHMNSGGAKHPFVDLKHLENNIQDFNSGDIRLQHHHRKQ